jgi:hypothetical protein
MSNICFELHPSITTHTNVRRNDQGFARLDFEQAERRNFAIPILTSFEFINHDIYVFLDPMFISIPMDIILTRSDVPP